MRGKTCCVTGHTKIPTDKLEYVERELVREIGAALADGYRLFITGFADGVDMLFARLVNKQREKYPDIFLEAALAYPGRGEELDPAGLELLHTCNGIKVVCKEFDRDCFFLRNRYMVQQSSRMIAVRDERRGEGMGGPLFAMDYARVMGLELRIIDI